MLAYKSSAHFSLIFIHHNLFLSFHCEWTLENSHFRSHLQPTCWNCECAKSEVRSNFEEMVYPFLLEEKFCSDDMVFSLFLFFSWFILLKRAFQSCLDETSHFPSSFPYFCVNNPQKSNKSYLTTDNWTKEILNRKKIKLISINVMTRRIIWKTIDMLIL